MHLKEILKFEGVSKYLINLEIHIFMETCQNKKIINLNIH